MNPRPRGKNTFAKIQDYPYSEWSKKRNKIERVVELSVKYSVPNLRDFALRVVEMKGDQEIKILSL